MFKRTEARSCSEGQKADSKNSFNEAYLLCSGGDVSKARARFAVVVSNAATTWKYFVSSLVTPRMANCASACRNHVWGLDVQKN